MVGIDDATNILGRNETDFRFAGSVHVCDHVTTIAQFLCRDKRETNARQTGCSNRLAATFFSATPNFAA